MAGLYSHSFVYIAVYIPVKFSGTHLLPEKLSVADVSEGRLVKIYNFLKFGEVDDVEKSWNRFLQIQTAFRHSSAGLLQSMARCWQRALHTLQCLVGGMQSEGGVIGEGTLLKFNMDTKNHSNYH